MRTNHNRPRGFTLVELMIVVSVVGLLAAISIPNYVRAREVSWRNICLNNLKKMQGAKTQAALEMRWSSDVGPATLGNPLYRNTISQYLEGSFRPVCPSGADCYYNAIGEDPTCTSGLPDHRFDFVP